MKELFGEKMKTKIFIKSAYYKYFGNDLLKYSDKYQYEINNFIENNRVLDIQIKMAYGNDDIVIRIDYE